MTVLACDAGLTRIKFGIVDAGRVLAHGVIPSHSAGGLGPRLAPLAEALRDLCRSVGITVGDCRGITLSVPSVVDSARQRAISEYGMFRDMPTLDLAAWAASELGLPVALENDARMACIGEWRHGAGMGSDDMVMITLGTGLGTGAVIGGRVLRGRHFQAGILGGHFTVREGGRACGCGNRGCAEAEASSRVLDELAREHPDFVGSALAGEPVIDYSAVLRNSRLGDPCAVALLDHSIRIWSALAVNLIHAYDPELVVIGGGLMASADVIVPRIAEAVADHAHSPWGAVRVVQGRMGDDAALVAAEWLLHEQTDQVVR